MRFLIGDLLHVARIETGSLAVAPEPSDIRILLDEAGVRFQSGDAVTPLRQFHPDINGMVIGAARAPPRNFVSFLDPV